MVQCLRGLWIYLQFKNVFVNVHTFRFKLTGMKIGLIWHRRLVVLTIRMLKDTTDALCNIG